MKKPKLTKTEALHELLRLLGTDKITLDVFWKQMKSYELTDADIDRYCRGER